MTEMDSVYSECFVWAVGLFVMGISFREFCEDTTGQWIGRSSVAASLFIMSAFSYYAHNRCEVIATTKGFTENVHQIAHVAAFTGVEVKTPNGTIVSWNEGRGWRSPVSITAGRDGRSSIAGPKLDRDFAGSDKRFNDVSLSAKRW